jgi:hypothetical protein
MHLEDEHIASFQRIYRERFGKDISREEALEKGTMLLRMVQLIYKPMTETEYACVKERQTELQTESTN